MLSDDLLQHPERDLILKKLKAGKTPREVARYLKQKYQEDERLHIDEKTLFKAAQEFPPKPKQKQWFSVTVEGEAPVRVRFRVFAEDEDQAFDMVSRSPQGMDGQPFVDLLRLRKRKVSIKNTLTGLINWVKQF